MHIRVNVNVHFLLSDEADKCNNGEAAADQALPPLRHGLQVRSADADDAENSTFDFSRQEQGEKLRVSASAANV